MMPFTPPPESVITKDLAKASDILARADSNRSTMPNRVMYELTAEFSARVGSDYHMQMDLAGSLQGMASSLSLYFRAQNVIGSGKVSALFDVVNERLRAAGQADSFKPEYPGWPAP